MNRAAFRPGGISVAQVTVRRVVSLLTRAAALLHELDVLEALAAATAVQVVAAHEPGRPWRGWMVQLGHDLYVRSVPDAGRRAGVGRAHLQLDGTRQPVMLAEVAPELHALLDDAFREKYGRCTPEIGAVTSDVAAASTFRVRLRRATWGERIAEAVDTALSRRPRRLQEPCPSC